MFLIWVCVEWKVFFCVLFLSLITMSSFSGCCHNHFSIPSVALYISVTSRHSFFFARGEEQRCTGRALMDFKTFFKLLWFGFSSRVGSRAQRDCLLLWNEMSCRGIKRGFRTLKSSRRVWESSEIWGNSSELCDRVAVQVQEVIKRAILFCVSEMNAHTERKVETWEEVYENACITVK